MFFSFLNPKVIDLIKRSPLLRLAIDLAIVLLLSSIFIILFSIIDRYFFPLVDKRLEAVYLLKGEDQNNYILRNYSFGNSRHIRGVRNCFSSIKAASGDRVGEICVRANFPSESLNLIKHYDDRLYFQNLEGITLLTAPDLSVIYGPEAFEKALIRINPAIRDVHQIKAEYDHLKVTSNLGETFFVNYRDLKAYPDLDELLASNIMPEQHRFTLNRPEKINKRVVFPLSTADMDLGYIPYPDFTAEIIKAYRTFYANQNNNALDYVYPVIVESGDVFGLNGRNRQQFVKLLPNGLIENLSPELTLFESSFVQVDSAKRTPALLENPDSFLISHYSTLEKKERLISRVGFDGSVLFTVSLNDYWIKSNNKIVSAMVVDEALLLVFKNARVVAINPNSGALLWKQ